MITELESRRETGRFSCWLFCADQFQPLTNLGPGIRRAFDHVPYPGVGEFDRGGQFESDLSFGLTEFVRAFYPLFLGVDGSSSIKDMISPF